MKFFSPVGWLTKTFAGERKAEKLQLLRQQHVLLHQGIESTAEVIDSSLSNGKVGSLLTVRLWLKLKKIDGSFVYTHANTLLSMRQIPVKGQMLRVKYLPENLSSILVI